MDDLYKIWVEKTTGSVIMYTNSELPELDSLVYVSYTVPDQFSNIFDKVKTGELSLGRLKVNVESKDFKIFNLDDLSFDDPEYGKWTMLTGYRKNPPAYADVVLKIFSKQFKPYLSIKFVGDPELLKDPKRHNLDFYVTALNDINCLYEAFHTDFDQLDKNYEIVYPIERVDPDNLFQNNFSIYYRKIFKTVYYIIE